MAPKPANELTEHLCQSSKGWVSRPRGWPPSPPARPLRALVPPQPYGGRARRGAPRPSQLRCTSRKLTTRSARRERKPGRLARAARLDRARWASSLTPAAGRASAGCRDEQCTCPTCAHTPLSHRRRGSGTGHKRREHWQLCCERCSQLLRASCWRCRLRRTEAAATLQRVVGLIPDLERGGGRDELSSPFAKHKHRSGAQARRASLRARLAGIFGKANLSASCR